MLYEIQFNLLKSGPIVAVYRKRGNPADIGWKSNQGLSLKLDSVGH